jgi:hypothetical protein
MTPLELLNKAIRALHSALYEEDEDKEAYALAEHALAVLQTLKGDLESWQKRN